MKECLLLSNSSGYNRPILEHCRDGIAQLFKGVSSVVFIPYAKKDHDGYVRKVEPFFTSLNIKVLPIHKIDPKEAIKSAEAIYIPGGNTYRLLNELYKHGIVDLIKEKVESGVKYVGSSAGSAVACPTIITTNDMQIVIPPSVKALGFIPFQLNCHYVEKEADSTHMGESREDRIREYHEENDTPVLGLREETWLHVTGDKVVLQGPRDAVLFEKGKKPQIIKSEETIHA